MKITFLGTGTSQGVPVISCDCYICQSKDARDKRLRSSIMIEIEGKTFVVDAGPDFRQQMLRANVRKMDAILFTHQHKDHVAGLDDVRAFNYLQKKPMEVYCDVRVEEALKREYAYSFAEEKYIGVPQINLNVIENREFYIQDIKIVPIEVFHHKLPVFGFRIGDFSYITDAKYIHDEEKWKVMGSKIVVVNALRIKEHPAHFNLEEALRFLAEIRPEKAFLTHIGHQMGLCTEMEKFLPNYVSFAHDGLTINI